MGKMAEDPRRLVARLAKQLPSIASARARASVFWLVGQYAASDVGGNNHGLGWEGVQAWVPDVLRQAVKGFAEEVSHSVSSLITVNPSQVADPLVRFQGCRSVCDLSNIPHPVPLQSRSIRRLV